MKPVIVTKEELLAIFSAGGRNSGAEKSHALPQEKYGDPAKTVKYERERNTKKKGRRK